MNLLLTGSMFLLVILSSSCDSPPENKNQKQQVSAQVQKEQGLEIKFYEYVNDKRVDVMIDGKLFTSYRWPDNVYKPILHPVLTSKGTEVTRGFPLKPREGERNDHMHQVGIWLNYGNINGYDFWGNGSEGVRNHINGGQIKHLSLERLSGGIDEGSMLTTASWLDPSEKELLAERTEYRFIAEGPIRIIDRISTLTASGGAVSFKDTKEGMFGIRVARQLELPSEGKVVLTNTHGLPATAKEMSNENVSGNYRNSNSVSGGAAWGKRAKWMNLYGKIGDEKISLVISDHPENPNYPTYWHTRGYGLFAANPFGVKDFTKGKEEMNYVIPAGESIILRYRVIISSGAHLTDAEINAYADDFARKY